MVLDSPRLPLPRAWGADLHKARERGWRLLSRLLSPTRPSLSATFDWHGEPKPSVPLRPYQLDGVSWLRFMRDNGMHGLLADGTLLS